MSDHDSVDTSATGPSEEEKTLHAFVKPIVLDETTVHRIAYEFSQVYRDLALNSDEQFLPTPVTKLPSGEETGSYLSIDVGGSNLRVAFIDLLGEEADKELSTNGKERSRETIKKAQRQRVQRRLEKAWPIGEHLKRDKTEDLFAWIGDCIAEVVGDRLSSSDVAHKAPPEELEMGITFSFPMLYGCSFPFSFLESGTLERFHRVLSVSPLPRHHQSNNSPGKIHFPPPH